MPISAPFGTLTIPAICQGILMEDKKSLRRFTAADALGVSKSQVTQFIINGEVLYGAEAIPTLPSPEKLKLMQDQFQRVGSRSLRPLAMIGALGVAAHIATNGIKEVALGVTVKDPSLFGGGLFTIGLAGFVATKAISLRLSTIAKDFEQRYFDYVERRNAFVRALDDTGLSTFINWSFAKDLKKLTTNLRMSVRTKDIDNVISEFSKNVRFLIATAEGTSREELPSVLESLEQMRIATKSTLDRTRDDKHSFDIMRFPVTHRLYRKELALLEPALVHLHQEMSYVVNNLYNASHGIVPLPSEEPGSHRQIIDLRDIPDKNAASNKPDAKSPTREIEGETVDSMTPVVIGASRVNRPSKGSLHRDTAVISRDVPQR